MGRRGLQEGMGGARQVSWPNRASPSVCRAREWLVFLLARNCADDDPDLLSIMLQDRHQRLQT